MNKGLQRQRLHVHFRHCVLFCFACGVFVFSDWRIYKHRGTTARTGEKQGERQFKTELLSVPSDMA